MLCLTKGRPKTQSIREQGKWSYLLEYTQEHLFAQLKRHMVAYRQMLLKVMALEQTLLSKMCSIFKEEVLRTAISKEQLFLE